jgi:hypothetical protein
MAAAEVADTDAAHFLSEEGSLNVGSLTPMALRAERGGSWL